MGQCGCGDMNLVEAIAIEGTEATLGIDQYHGCQYCNNPLGYTLMVFDPAGVERWVRGYGGKPTSESITPDEDGGNHGHGIWLPFIGREDLMDAAREDDELGLIDLAEYGTLCDLLDEYGLRLLRAAWEIHHRKQAEIEGRLAARGSNDA